MQDINHAICARVESYNWYPIVVLQPLVMNLACVYYRMTMPEVLFAATINAAASLGKACSHGSIEVGKMGDLVVLDTTRYEVCRCNLSQNLFVRLFGLPNLSYRLQVAQS